MINEEELQVLLDLQNKGLKFIARDKNGNLWAYSAEPRKKPVSWYPPSSPLLNRTCPMDDCMLRFITWEQEKAWKIEEVISYLLEEKRGATDHFDSHYDNLSKEIFDLKAQNQMLKLKLSAIIAKHKIGSKRAYKKGFYQGWDRGYYNGFGDGQGRFNW